MADEQLTPQAEAALETTSPERLAELAESDDEAVREAVVRNPNTPPEILYRLGVEFPAEFLGNPVIELMLLDIDSFMKEVPRYLYLSLSLYKETPDFLKRYIVKNDERINALADHTSNKEIIFSEDARISISDSLFKYLGTPILKHPDFPRSRIRHIYRDSLEYVKHLFEEYDAFGDECDCDSLSLSICELIRFLEAPDCPIFVVWELEEALQEEYGNNGDSWKDICDKLQSFNEDTRLKGSLNFSFDWHGFVRERKKAWENAPLSAWIELAQHPCLDVRVMVAKRPECPKEVLDILKEDENRHASESAIRA